jgi:hypothetical protein
MDTVMVDTYVPTRVPPGMTNDVVAGSVKQPLPAPANAVQIRCVFVCIWLIGTTGWFALLVTTGQAPVTMLDGAPGVTER